MSASGSSIFANADGYQASVRDMLDLLVLQPRGFQARLTWLDLPTLQLLRAQESSRRVAFVTFPPEVVFVTFSTEQDSRLIYRGAELPFGDIIFHSRGERGHQRTTGSSRWGSISLPPGALASFSWTIAGLSLAPPAVGQVLRPLPADRRQLLRLHAQAGRITETHLDRIAHKEVARAIEQELILALVHCLTTGTAQSDPAGHQQQACLLVRLEALLAAHPGRLLHTQDICRDLGVSASKLRGSCLTVLGMGHGSYQRLRRLKQVRLELTHAKSAAAEAGEIVKRYGFEGLHRFVTDYWNAFGEMPPLPTRDP
jgi:AraC-like DNA-binding protein